MNLFRIVLFGVFIFFTIFAVLVFSGILPIFRDAPEGIKGTVTIWGTMPEEFLAEPIRNVNLDNQGIFSIQYSEKRPGSFDRELVEALASDKGPDMIILPQDLIVRQADRVFPLPFENYSERVFRDTFAEAGELYLSEEGILALPVLLDPMVMYWNRDLYSAEGIATPPTFWDTFFIHAPVLTVKDETGNIQKSAVALGEYQNISHAKDILSLLILQAGNPIVKRDNGNLSVVLRERMGKVVPPAESALRFYTEFANPAKPSYSWSRALSNSKDMFLAGDLATYFGFASDRVEIEARSPNLNFDAARIPQPREGEIQKTFADMFGIAVLKGTRNLQTAFHAALILSGDDFVSSLANASGLPPARRDLLSEKPSDAFGALFYESALISDSWLDPNPAESKIIFQTMIENVLSGRSTIGQAIERARKELESLLPEGARRFPRVPSDFSN